ncbi:MAG: HD-GYP domain-containing protein, partial [Planctomycetota bacterium]|nr:HD-GYP domain-containing protein [Planctomycetota bacterium]
PVDAEGLLRLVEHLGLKSSSRPFVANPPVTDADTWPYPQIRQAVIVPLAEGDNVFGWLAAINHVDGNKKYGDVQIGRGEFGTVEASLLSSVGAILGIHSGNIDLYRQQAEMFSGVVRALTSVIDAKDRYTRGHSDRVARIAVRLASEIGCPEETLKSIYLAGLLHDIGKIGIDDQVLRKPGKLSDEEYEHIKSHVEIGYRILFDLKQMDDVLPVVLYHHEAWDGGGYPHRLPREEIPLAARIVAVADSYDAMSSDRPYRKGMPEERIDEIFREGSGTQWDPQVVEAFYAARDDICQIADHQ